MTDTWRACSNCKKPIRYGQLHWVCSVSTCNRARSPYVFCKVDCWDAHVPVMRHRSAWAEEATAPRAPARDPAPRPTTRLPQTRSPTPPTTVRRTADGAQRRVVRPAGSGRKETTPREVLIVASRLKDYIKARGDMNTSADVLEILSDHVRFLCNDAIDQARADGRRTVKARDFPKG